MEEMPYETFVRWNRYNMVDPFGRERGDIQAATITASVINTLIAINTPKGRRPKTFDVTDFVPQYTETDLRPTKKKPMGEEEWSKFKSMMGVSYQTAK